MQVLRIGPAVSGARRLTPALAIVTMLLAAPAAGGAPPTIWTVTSASDSGPGTLRQAILDANASATEDIVEFALPGCSPTCVIVPSIALPILAGGNVTIDGFSQPGARAPSAGSPALIAVALDGRDVENYNGLSITSGGNTIKGLAIYGFGWNGIAIGGPEASNNRVRGNHIGVDAAGVGADCAKPNGMDGVFIGLGAQHNNVGGIILTDRNVISGNTWDGVGVHGEGTLSNAIKGNLIGLDALGETAVPNALDGVRVYGGAGQTMIGAIGEDNEGNVISGNGRDGIRMVGAATRGLQAEGNRIGTNALGTAAVGNAGDGVHLLDGAGGLGMGVPGALSNGLISGNGGHGVHSEGGTAVVRRQLIGVDASGRIAMPNQDGVRFVDVPTSAIGGSEPGDGNVISGNRGAGVVLMGPGTTEVLVLGNRIGVDTTGRAALGNEQGGVRILSGASNNSVGLADGVGNVISGNGRSGVEIDGVGSDDNKIRSNRIGTDSDGEIGLGNFDAGIHVRGGAKRTNIGALADEHGNWIVDNGVGISLQNVGSGTLIYHNRIGVGADPDAEGLGNSAAGLRIEDGTVGTFSQHNVIAHNGEQGVLIAGSPTIGNRFTAESIHDNGGFGIWVTSGAHGGIERPEITSYDPIGQRVRGTGCTGCNVEIYSDAEDEGAQFLARGVAGTGGVFAITLSEPPAHGNLTAFVTDPTLGTSAFSAPVPAVAVIPTPTATATVTASPTLEPTETATVGDTTTPTSTPTSTAGSTVHATDTLTPTSAITATPSSTPIASATDGGGNTATATVTGGPTATIAATRTGTPDPSTTPEAGRIWLPLVLRLHEVE